MNRVPVGPMADQAKENTLEDERGCLVKISGDDFAAEFQRCRPMLLKVALQRTRSRSNAEDMVQQTFLQAWKARASFQGKARLSTWFTRILLNEIYQVHRRSEHKQLEYTHEPALLERQRAKAGLFPATRSAESELLKHERTVLAREVMKSLSARLQSVLLLEIYAGRTTEEICVELNLTPAAVKARKLRARLELERRLKSRYRSRVRC